MIHEVWVGLGVLTLAPFWVYFCVKLGRMAYLNATKQFIESCCIKQPQPPKEQ